MRNSLLKISIAISFLIYGNVSINAKTKDEKSNTKIVDSLQVENESLKRTIKNLEDTISIKFNLKNFTLSDFPQVVDSIISDKSKNLRNTQDSTELVNLKQRSAELDSITLITQSYRLFYNQFFGKAFTLTHDKGITGSWRLDLTEIKVVNDSTGSGLIINTGLEPRIAKITFLDNEIAEILLTNNVNSKAVYQIVNFSTSSPFFIDVISINYKIRIFVVNTEQGVQVSYKSANGNFMYGFMRREN